MFLELKAMFCDSECHKTEDCVKKPVSLINIIVLSTIWILWFCAVLIPWPLKLPLFASSILILYHWISRRPLAYSVFLTSCSKPQTRVILWSHPQHCYCLNLETGQFYTQIFIGGTTWIYYLSGKHNSKRVT